MVQGSERGNALSDKDCVQLMHLEAVPDSFKQHDCQPPAQVLAELVQAGQDAPAALSAIQVLVELGDMGHRGRSRVQTGARDSLPIGSVKEGG